MRAQIDREGLMAAAFRLAVARAQVSATFDSLRGAPKKDLRQLWRAYAAIDRARSALDDLWYRRFPTEPSPVYPADHAAEIVVRR